MRQEPQGDRFSKSVKCGWCVGLRRMLMSEVNLTPFAPFAPFATRRASAEAAGGYAGFSPVRRILRRNIALLGNGETHLQDNIPKLMPPSRLQLPPGPWPTILDCLCAHFPAIPRDTWISRFTRGLILDASGAPLPIDAPYRLGAEIQYFREVVDEPVIPFAESILHADADLVVADKPHFLPVTPAGGFVRETLLARLVQRLGNPDLVPLHRIDRDTAGLVLFSANAATRAIYQALFRERRIYKRYEAIAPALASASFPLLRATRIVRGEPFFRMQEVDGTPNSETRIEVLEGEGALWRYGLEPVTGRKHQLRVHMAALGAPIANDRWYPRLGEAESNDYTRPLKLLARSLRFVDPVSGVERGFESGFRLVE